MSVPLQTKWLKFRISLLSLKFQKWQLRLVRSTLTFRQTVELNSPETRTWHDNNVQYMPTCCDKSGGLSHVELRALSSTQIAVLHRTSPGRKSKQEKKEMYQDSILKHSRVKRRASVISSLLPLRIKSIRKNFLP